MSRQQHIDRRQFLSRAARGLLAAGLTGGMGSLVLRNGKADADCARTISCGACRAFGHCALARAIAARENPASNVPRR